MLSRAMIATSLVVLGLLAGYVVLLPPSRASATRLELCPREILGLSGTDTPAEQRVLDDLAPDALLMRTYQAPDSPPVWLVIVYHENARLGAHDPRLCYRSQGFMLQELPAETLETGLGPVPVQRFLATRGTRIERVSYFWYTSGERAMAEVKAFRDDMFFQGLRSNRSFGAFVRVSTVVGADPGSAEALVDGFITMVAPVLPRIFPEKS